MNYEFLKNYAVIVDCGSVSAASRRLNTSQSALSRQVGQLEEMYGTELLIRHPRNVEPTEAGMRLYRYASLLNELDRRILQDMQDIAAGVGGTLRLGLTYNYDERITKALVNFHKMYPRAKIELHEEHSPAVLGMLKNDLLEIGIVTLSKIRDPEVEIVSESKMNMYAVFPRDNPWGQKDDGKEITLKSLIDIPLSTSKGFQDDLTKAFRNLGSIPHYMSSNVNLEMSLMWAKAGVAAAIVMTNDQRQVQTETTFGKILKIREFSELSQMIVINKGKNLSLVAREFLRNYMNTKA